MLQNTIASLKFKLFKEVTLNQKTRWKEEKQNNYVNTQQQTWQNDGMTKWRT